MTSENYRRQINASGKKSLQERRRFLKSCALAVAGHGLSPLIAKALAVPGNHKTRTLADIEHIVVLMQENRSFDHYFGTLRGVRGFSDPRPIPLPGGRSVWRQSGSESGPVLPFPLDIAATRAEWFESLNHDWKESHEKWKRHDAWIDVKGPMTMGHFRREDIPFYYALADAFTICDAYHCSVFGPTHPNRLFLWSGTSGLSVGRDGEQAIVNGGDANQGRPDPSKDDPSVSGYDWITYPERLQAAGIDWKIYQEYDNFGCNLLVNFAAYRGSNASPELIQRARTWAIGSSAADVVVRGSPTDPKNARAEHLIAAFSDDVANGRLPQVSWIIAPTWASEHPRASPSLGENLVASLLAALTAHPEVWSKTAFILNYDENDGLFDHVPPPLPSVDKALGNSTVDTRGESYHGEPMGLGCRVPMLVISPWTRGGWVNSQVFDHTSIIRLLEARFGVHELNITPWRRAICGDLTSVFDFSGEDTTPPKLIPTADLVARARAAATLPGATPPTNCPTPRQEAGQRPARALPYDLQVHGRVQKENDDPVFAIEFANQGVAGAAFNVYAPDSSHGPWFYTVEAGKRLSDSLPTEAGAYDFSVFGPNGFLREFKGHIDRSMLEVTLAYQATLQRIALTLTNTGNADCRATVQLNDYLPDTPRTYSLAPGAARQLSWSLAKSAHWYDLVVTSDNDSVYRRRLAGHMETGQPSWSDPAIGRV
jgi:phospholipase C